MRKSLSSIPVATLLALACGSSDSKMSNDPILPPAGSSPAAGLRGVFVSSSQGILEGDGSFSRPLKSLAAAVALAQENGLPVIACAETFTERIEIMKGNVTIEGGYDCENLSWKRSDRTTRLVSMLGPVLRIVGAGSVKLTQLDVEAEDVATEAPIAFASSIAVEVRRSASLQISKCRIRSGHGRNGRDAIAPPPFVPERADGVAAQAAHKCGGPLNPCGRPMSPLNAPGSEGGLAQCAAADGATTLSGGGGTGGDSGHWVSDPGTLGTWVVDPTVGLPQDVSISTSLGGAVNNNGRPGLPGLDGEDGSNGTGELRAHGFVTQYSVPGRAGTSGTGGGGGGAGLPTKKTNSTCGNLPCFISVPPFDPGEWFGATGGGGGAGGCPGRVATPAEGGGASIAIFIESTDVALTEATIEAGAGGRGGKGSFGAPPTGGGVGGAAAPVGGGSAGGAGGPGGTAGFTGHGASAPSYGIVHMGAAPRLTGTTILVGAAGAPRDEMRQGTRAIPKTSTPERADVKPLTLGAEL